MSLPPQLGRLRLPAIGAPLFIVSNPDLVIAQCKAGIVGSFPALNARPQSLLDDWLHRITEELSAWDRDNPDRPSAPISGVVLVRQAELGEVVSPGTPVVTIADVDHLWMRGYIND